MEKQHNQITTTDLIHTIKQIKKSKHSNNWIIQHLFWLQDSIISESYNFNAINSVLMKYHVRDVDTAPFNDLYGKWYINDKPSTTTDVNNILNSIINNLYKVQTN